MRDRVRWGMRPIPVLLGALLIAEQASAFEIDMGESDFGVRFDNTVRYNAAWRMAERDSRIANNPSQDENEFSFDKGDMVNNRVDLFTEFDINYKKRFGARVTGSLWADGAYGDSANFNPALAAVSNYPDHRYSRYTKRFTRGPSGEWGDAFVWGTWELGGDRNLDLKVGRHVQLWGEAVFGTASANSVAYSQAPSDGLKGAMSPGATAKETVMPLNQVTGSLQITPRLSVAGLYTFEWRPSRVPEGGTYFGLSDAILFGPPKVSATVRRADAIEGHKGDVGLALRWTPEWLDEPNLGVYYRKFDDKSPTWSAQTVPRSGLARAVYANDIELWGVSVGTSLFGTAVSGEVSHRRNMPLLTTGATTQAQGFQGPRGETWHALINTSTNFSTTPLWDTAALVTELTYQRLDKVTKNSSSFRSKATTPGVCFDEIAQACATKEAWHLAVSFTPSWSQVLPGVNLSAPMVYQVGLKGNAATTGIAEGGQVLRVGLAADYRSRHRFELAYTAYDGKKRNLGATGAAGPFWSLNGTPAAYSDRDFLSFTYTLNM